MYGKNKQTEFIRTSVISAERGQEAGSDEKGKVCWEQACSLPSTTTTTYEDGNNTVPPFFVSGLVAAGTSREHYCSQLQMRIHLLSSDTYRRVALVLTHCDAMHRNGIMNLADTNHVMAKRAIKILFRCGFLDVINTPAKDPRTAPLLFFLRRELVTLPERQLKFFALKPEAREMFLRCAPLFEDGLDPEFLARLKNYKRELVDAHARFSRRQAEQTRRPNQRDLEIRGSGRWVQCDPGTFVEVNKPRRGVE